MKPLMKTHIHGPRRIMALAMGISLLGATLVAAPADAAGTPSGPQYSYRMINATKTGSRVKSNSISAVYCVRAGEDTGSATYSSATTQSNTFTFTANLGFEALKGLLKNSYSGSVAITNSSTVTETISVNVAAGKCVQAFALRDVYSYNLQRKCNWVCGGVDINKAWITKGSGAYKKFVGRAYYRV